MIGTRLMRFLSSNVAISLSGVSGVAVITERVMTSVTLCECDFTYSAASTCLPVRYSSHQERLRLVPASARRMRSPSLTIPRSSPCSSITGTALMRLARRMLATSSTRALGRTLMTAQTITSAAFMSHTPLVRRYMDIGTSAPPLNGFAGRGASRVIRRSHNSRANRRDLAKLDRPTPAPDPTHNLPGSRTGRNTSGDDEAKQDPKEARPPAIVQRSESDTFGLCVRYSSLSEP